MKITATVNKEQGKKWLNRGGIFVLLIAVVLLVCSILIHTKYSNVGVFWKYNDIRITQEFNVIDDVEASKTVLNQEKHNRIASEDFVNHVNKLKKGITKYYKNEYGIDVSEKINKLNKVYIFDAEEYNNEILEGYVNDDEKAIHINEDILNNKMLDTVIIHEITHYLGINRNSNIDGMYFIEGLTDALTQKCMEYLNLQFISSDGYDLARNLSLQILVVDKEIVIQSLTTEDFDIMNRINQRLENVDRSMIYVDDVAQNLEYCIRSLYFQTTGEVTDFVILQAQDIVSSYCKTFNPNVKQIRQIQKYYLFDKYEDIKIVIRGNKMFLTI